MTRMKLRRTPRARVGAARLAWLLVVLFPLGCSNVVPEPDDNYSDLPVQTYPFAAVWESLMASVTQEGFTVDASATEREGKAGGTFTTLFKVTNTDEISGAQEGKKIRVRVKQSAKNTYGVEVAAGVFTRQTRQHDWSYQKTDPELLERIETNLGQTLRARYRTGGGQ